VTGWLAGLMDWLIGRFVAIRLRLQLSVESGPLTKLGMSVLLVLVLDEENRLTFRGRGRAYRKQLLSREICQQLSCQKVRCRQATNSMRGKEIDR